MSGRKISARMADVLYHVSTTDDRSVIFLYIVEGLGKQLKALFNRGLIEVECIEHPAGSVFPGSKEWTENRFKLTAAGEAEIAKWSFEEVNE